MSMRPPHLVVVRKALPPSELPFADKSKPPLLPVSECPVDYLGHEYEQTVGGVWKARICFVARSGECQGEFLEGWFNVVRRSKAWRAPSERSKLGEALDNSVGDWTVSPKRLLDVPDLIAKLRTVVNSSNGSAKRIRQRYSTVDMIWSESLDHD